MNAEILEYVEEESIKVKFPLYEKYNNPAGLILGGFLPVFFDLSFGPLSYLVAKKPTTSLDLNTTFIRPITIKDKEIIIKTHRTRLLQRTQKAAALKSNVMSDNHRLNLFLIGDSCV